MAKKSFPIRQVFHDPVFTFFVLFILAFILIFLFFKYYMITPISQTSDISEKVVIVNNLPPPPQTDRFNDLYSPPLKNNSTFFNSGPSSSYSQIGIITRNNGDISGNKLILPLMGRLLHSRRDKWQYYTVSNTGSVNSKLPLRFKGRNCLSENGCDEIFNNDPVYVEGYNDTFLATIYENRGFMYEPLI